MGVGLTVSSSTRRHNRTGDGEGVAGWELGGAILACVGLAAGAVRTAGVSTGVETGLAEADVMTLSCRVSGVSSATSSSGTGAVDRLGMGAEAAGAGGGVVGAGGCASC